MHAAWLRSMLAVSACTGALLAAQQPLLAGHARTLAIDELNREGVAALKVTSPSFASGEEMPREMTAGAGNIFPGLAWSEGPAGTRSYVVVMQGRTLDDAHAGNSIHFVLFNVPADVHALARGATTAPAGAELGPNVHGDHEWYAGPHAHPGAKNGYHFQVFALDRTLLSGEVSGYEALINAMRGHTLAAGETVGLASYDPAAGAPHTVLAGPVEVSGGKLQGVPGRNPAITVFRGVPYAAAPVGALRFHAPEPPTPWSGVRLADQYGKLCPQPGDPSTMSEDCLSANVWTGAAANTEKRPVFVWIYGGGFSMGSGSDPTFDGEALAAKGVVVVTFNYRIGVLGFLATPELSRESGHHASGNFGLLDDVQLLTWVRDNIAAFGGDPARVTIGGQSAGAASVGFLAMSPLARGLFAQGIEESHARYSHDTELRYLSVSYRRLANAEAQGVQFAESRGAHSLAELRALPWQQLLLPRDASDMAVETGSDAKPPLFRPVVDGWVLPEDYSHTFADGIQNKIAVITGNNRDETGAVPESTFAARRASPARPTPGNPHINVTLQEFHAAAQRKFGPLAAEYLRVYPARTDEEAAEASDESARDNSRISTYLWGLDWKKHCAKPLYNYFWTHRPTNDPGGAHHASEILFVFDNLDLRKNAWTEEDRRVASVVSGYWVNFISHSNPNGEGLPAWKTFDAKSRSVMELGDHFASIPIATPERLAFWKKFFATQPAW